MKAQLKAGVASEASEASHLPRFRPSLHDFLGCGRQALPILVGTLIALAVLVPVSTAIVFERSIFNINYTHEQLRFRFFDGDLAWLVNLAAVAAGMALALVLFKFLFDKRQTATWFSLGLSRVRLYLNRCVIGVVYLLLGLGLPFAASLAMNVYALEWFSGELYEFCFVLFGYYACALVAFFVTALACVCAGTLFEALAFGLALLGGVSALAFGGGALFDHLLVGNAFGELPSGLDVPVAPSLLDGTALLNPVLFFANLGAGHQSFSIMHPVYEPVLDSPLLIVAWLGVALVLAAGSCLLFVRRPGEQAQMAGLCTPLLFVTVALVAFLVFSVAFFLIAPVDILVATVCAFLFFALISIFLLRGPLRGRTPLRRTLLVAAGQLVVVGAAVACIASGGLGFASYIPPSSAVAGVEVSYVGTPNYLARTLSGTSGDGVYYYHLEYSFADDLQALAIVQDVQARLIDSARAELRTNAQDFAQVPVRYDLVLRYKMVDGGEVVRYYDRARSADLQALLALDDSARLRQLEQAVITGNTASLDAADALALGNASTALAYQNGSVFLADANYNRVTELELLPTARQGLLRALAADVAAQSAANRYSQPDEPQGVLLFTNAPQIDAQRLGFSFSSAAVPLDASFVRTLSWLEDNQLLDLLSTQGLDPALIEELVFLDDNPYASVVSVAVPTSRYFLAYRTEVPGRFWVTQDFGSLQSLRSADEIAEVTPHLKTACFMDGGLLVQAKLQGIEAYVYYYLPRQQALMLAGDGLGMVM